MPYLGYLAGGWFRGWFWHPILGGIWRYWLRGLTERWDFGHALKYPLWRGTQKGHFGPLFGRLSGGHVHIPFGLRGVNRVGSALSQGVVVFGWG
jgi:hypothetical protein